MKIVERTPITQTRELIRFEDGREVTRCYTSYNPRYYKNHNEDLLPIDLNFEKTASSKVGNIRIREKNVNSVGYRESNDPHKYIGIRPDRNQEFGTEQLEFTIKEIIVNDENIPIDLSKNEVVEGRPNIVNLGNVLIHIESQFTRQIINPDRKIESFKITYLIHLKNLETSNQKDEETGFFIPDENEEFSFTSPTSDTEYMVNLPLLLDENFEEVHYFEEGDPAPYFYENLTRHTLRDLGNGVLEYVKHSSGEQIPESAKYIDVATCGGNTPCPSTDAYMYKNFPTVGGSGGNIADTWTAAKSATHVKTNKRFNGTFGFVNNLKSGSQYKISRTVFKFDTSGISGASLVTFNYYASHLNPATTQQAYTNTRGELSDGTFTRLVLVKSTWSGGTVPKATDWDEFAIEQYGTAVPYSNTDGTVTVYQEYNVVTMNSTAVSDINSSSEWKFGAVTYHDNAGANYPPPDGLDTGIYSLGMYMINRAGVAFDPYLDITSGYAGIVIGVDGSDSEIAKIIGMTTQQVKNVMGE